MVCCGLGFSLQVPGADADVATWRRGLCMQCSARRILSEKRQVAWLEESKGKGRKREQMEKSAQFCGCPLKHEGFKVIGQGNTLRR